MSTATFPVARPAAPSSPAATSRPVGNVLVWSITTVVVFATIVLGVLGGWDYYTTPLARRGALATHRLLRPAAPLGHLFGIVGFLMMLAPVAYAMRKNIPALRRFGSMKTWLDIHVFSGIVGPVLVTFHTSFKFNGVVSVAYWSMVAVVMSGFVGRYLYARIPRSLRGIELSHAELDTRAETLSAELADADPPAGLRAAIDAFERRVVPASADQTSFFGLFFGEMRMRRELAMLRRRIEESGAAPEVLQSIVHVIAERATLLRQAAYLTRTHRLFELWHVFHMPLVYIMFAIVAVHVAVTVYMGYLPFVY